MPEYFEDFWKPIQDEKMEEINAMKLRVDC